MEIVSFLTDVNELPEALSGRYGKEIGKGYKIAYLGSVIIGEAESMDILDKNCKCQHYNWNKVSDDVYLAFIK